MSELRLRNTKHDISLRNHDCLTYFISIVMSAFRLSPAVASRGLHLRLNLMVKVLDSVKSGGPKGTVDRTVFEMWLGSL